MGLTVVGYCNLFYTISEIRLQREREVIMNNSWNIVAIIGSVIIPLVVFMFALRPWVRNTARDAVSNIGIELASLRAELKAYREAQKEYIEIYKLIANPRNPHPGKEVLLEKLKNDTLTREEAIALQQIMNEERQRAEEQNDFLKAIVIIGILALIAYAISRS